ncbi:MAG TPA: hypothetical protein VGM83_16095 [Devosiaceae bacterium]|jgi:hypothetical protein
MASPRPHTPTDEELAALGARLLGLAEQAPGAAESPRPNTEIIVMTPPEHVAAARQALTAVATGFDFDIWHETWASDENYLHLPDAEAQALDAMAEAGRRRVMALPPAA